MLKQLHITLFAFLSALASCGREPSRLLRQGQLPIYDFPLYLTEGASGNLWRIDRDRTKTLVHTGFNDPRGVATDRFGSIYVAEYGAGRVLKIVAGLDDPQVIADGLIQPAIIAVDSFGEVYVTQDGMSNITRISDHKIFATYDTKPTALAFGVDDVPLVGLYDQNRLLWGWDVGTSYADVSSPVNVSIDNTGRVYAAGSGDQEGQVIRYHQRSPDDATVVADNLIGPAGIAIDPAGNIFVVEQGAKRIVLITYNGTKFEWITDVVDPQYLAFSQY